MKKNKIIFILELLVFSLVIIFATIVILRIKNKDKDSIIKCNSEYIKYNEEIECRIVGKKYKYKVSNVSMKLTLPKELELKKIKVDPSWQGNGENGTIELYTDENKLGKFPIANFKVKLKEKTSKELIIKLEKIYYYDENFEEHAIKNAQIKIKAKNGGK